MGNNNQGNNNTDCSRGGGKNGNENDSNGKNARKFRSRDWFDNPDHIDLTALYLERFMNHGTTPEELQSGKPIIGIAQSGSDLNPCNRIHLDLLGRIRDGIRDGGGIPLSFPTHPTFENCKRPTAALDRNLAYLGLVEILNGYPLDAVVLTTGCDKTTPFMLMAAITVDIPAIVLSGGPMLDGWHEGRLVGSGTVIWKSRHDLAAGLIDERTFMERAAQSAPSPGHCNTMGTALTMNSLAEAMGMSLSGCASIPAPYRERGQMAYKTGKRIVEMAHEDLKPSDIIGEKAIANAIVTNSALGGSTNAQPHITAIARHAGVSIGRKDWQTLGLDVPLLANVQPAGEYLGESFHRAGGVPALMSELLKAGKIDGSAPTVSGKTLGENLENCHVLDRKVIYSCSSPLKKRAGYMVLKGNMFEFAIMKTSVISEEFRKRYLERKGQEGVFKARAVVFESSEDYHERINDPALEIDENCMLVIRGAGPVGWPGSAEVVNMQPPEYLIRKGVSSLPTLGDGRQSGTSASPSILHVTPESAVGGNIGLLKTGDIICIDLNRQSCDMLVKKEEIERRRTKMQSRIPESQTPWQEIYRQTVGPLADGAVMEPALKYRRTSRKLPRHNH